MNISLFAQPGRDESTQAMSQLREAFPEADISVINVSETMTELYPCPFIQEEGAGGAFYGMNGIETFIRFRKTGEHKHPVAAETRKGKGRRADRSGLKPLSASV